MLQAGKCCCGTELLRQARWARPRSLALAQVQQRGQRDALAAGLPLWGKAGLQGPHSLRNLACGV